MIEHVNPSVVLRSRPTSILLTKFWTSLLFVIPALGILVEDFPTWRIVFASPFFLAGLFQVSIAILELRDGVLRYKRFLSWTTIHENEIVAAGILWHPFIGYIRLNRYVFPWGRLYFALDKNTESNPFRRGAFPLVRYLNRGEVHKEAQTSLPSSTSNSSTVRLLLAAFIGILVSLMILYITPGDLLQGGSTKSAPGMPPLLKTLFHFTAWLYMPIVQIAGLVLMVFLAVRRRDQGEAWLYAFLSGFALPFIVGRLLF